jgi:hypothetical protein
MDINRDEILIKKALRRTPDISAPEDFGSNVMERISGGGRHKPGIGYGWKVAPVPAAAVLLITIAILGGGFVSAFAGKLRNHCASAQMGAIAKETFVVSAGFIKRYCGEVKERGIGAVIGATDPLCLMKNCRKMASECSAACAEECAHAVGEHAKEKAGK